MAKKKLEELFWYGSGNVDLHGFYTKSKSKLVNPQPLGNPEIIILEGGINNEKENLEKIENFRLRRGNAYTLGEEINYEFGKIYVPIQFYKI